MDAQPRTPAAKTARLERVRRERGRLLAERLRITRRADGLFMVPASSGPDSYVVDHGTDGGESCSCQDFELRGAVTRCKHLWAVEYSRRSDTMADGSAKAVTTKRVTYQQNWHAYNAAQAHEREHVADLISSLCDGIVDPPQVGRGNRRMPMRDRIFVTAMKVFDGFSARRVESDMAVWHKQGYVARPYAHGSIFKSFEDPEMTPILRALVEESASPLASVETVFAPDSSGFSSCSYVRWFDEKYGRERSEHDWIKVHVMVGCKTNIVTAIKISDKEGNDSPELPALLDKTTERFTPRDVVADKGYLSYTNQQAIVDKGAACFIPFKVNSVAESKAHHKGGTPELWTKLFHYFQFQRRAFLRHYNQRSNVESTFSGVKRVFGGSLRSKVRVAQENEVLAKFLCWNLSCLVHEIYELGIEPMFWEKAAPPTASPTRTRTTRMTPSANWDDVEVSHEWGGSAARFPGGSGAKRALRERNANNVKPEEVPDEPTD